ncbi:MAG: hypothetical protein G8237_08925 [Magnetococcales bacterium]|nr:hypothetical protein [Magnetococcales bacterium]
MSAHHHTLEVVRFCLGNWPAAVEARTVLACRQLDPDTPDPALSDLTTLPGLSPDAHNAPRLVLEWTDGNARACWVVTGPVTLSTLPITTIHPLPPLLAMRARLPGVCALAWPANAHEQEVILLMDLTRISKPVAC